MLNLLHRHLLSPSEDVSPLEDVLTLSILALCSNSFIRTLQMLMHEKHADPYIYKSPPFILMGMILFRLRAPKAPDNKADMETHTFTYALMPYKG